MNLRPLGYEPKSDATQGDSARVIAVFSSILDLAVTVNRMALGTVTGTVASFRIRRTDWMNKQR